MKNEQRDDDLLFNSKVCNLEGKKVGILQSSHSRPSSQTVAVPVHFNLYYLAAVHRPAIRICCGAVKILLNFPLRGVTFPPPPALTLQSSGEPGGHNMAQSYNGDLKTAVCTQMIRLALCSNSTDDFSHCSHHNANTRKERWE
jgi:hypothetical protein